MGSGKTTLGTLLARQLAWRFVDLDERIEQSAGLAIPQIFERFGEDGFFPTLGAAVGSYRAVHPVEWNDWEEG